MSTVEVLFCHENLQRFGREAVAQLAGRSDLRVQVVKCLIACSECSAMPIARVNGQLVAADNWDELMAAINQLVQQMQET